MIKFCKRGSVLEDQNLNLLSDNFAILFFQAGQKCENKPDKYGAYMTKKRKWPMKGWHKVNIPYYYKRLVNHPSFDLLWKVVQGQTILGQFLTPRKVR